MGSNGQDGQLLKRSLNDKFDKIICITRDRIIINNEDFGQFSIFKKSDVKSIINKYRPKEIYYLATINKSSEKETTSNFEVDYKRLHAIHVLGLLNFLSAVRLHLPNCRLFYASSSLVFDGSNGVIQNENTPFSPVGLYGITKLEGLYLCREYRENFGLYISVGILYTHESKYRTEDYLSKKLIVGAEQISKGLKSELIVGNLNTKNDWSYAGDFIDAFQLLLRLETPSDCIVASGEAHSVFNFAKFVFNEFNLNAEEFLNEDNNLNFRKTNTRVGDISKITKLTGWRPKYSFEEMCRLLVYEYRESI